MQRISVSSLGWLLLLIPALYLSSCSTETFRVTGHHDRLSVGLVQMVDDPVFAEAREGFMAALNESEYPPEMSVTVEWTSAQGQYLALKPILSTYVTEHKDLIVTLGSPCLERAIEVVDKTPLVFGVAINPKVLGLNVKQREGLPNFTGTYSEPPLDELGAIIRSIMPEARRLGTIWNPSEINSRYEMHFLRQMSRKYGFEVVEIRVRNSERLESATRQLLDSDIDFVLIIADNTVMEGFEEITPLFREQKLPIFTDLPALVKEGGADLGWGFDFYEWGRITGRLAVQVLSGTPPLTIPITRFTHHRLVVHPASIKALGLSIPEEVMSRADSII